MTNDGLNEPCRNTGSKLLVRTRHSFFDEQHNFARLVRSKRVNIFDYWTRELTKSDGAWRIVRHPKLRKLSVRLIKNRIQAHQPVEEVGSGLVHSLHPLGHRAQSQSWAIDYIQQYVNFAPVLGSLEVAIDPIHVKLVTDQPDCPLDLIRAHFLGLNSHKQFRCIVILEYGQENGLLALS